MSTYDHFSTRLAELRAAQKEAWAQEWLSVQVQASGILLNAWDLLLHPWHLWRR